MIVPPKPPNSGTVGSIALWRTVILVILLGWVPLFIALFLGHRILDGREEVKKENNSELLSLELNRISRLLDPEVNLQMRFQQWSGLILKSGPAIDLVGFSSRFSRLVGAEVSLMFFSSDGTIDQKRNVQISNRYILERFVQILTRPANEAVSLMRQNRKKLNAVFGPDTPFLAWREREGKAVSFIQRGQRGMLFWKRNPGGSGEGLLFVVWHLPDPHFMFEQTVKKRIGPRRSLFLRKGVEEPRLIAGLPRSTLDRAFLGLSGSQEPVWFDGKTGWTSTRAGGSSFLYARDLTDAGVDPWRVRVNLLFLILIIFSSVAGFSFFRPGSKAFLSIRWKLVFLFVLSLYLPVAGVSFLGFRTLQDRREVLNAEVSRLARDAIGRLDGAFANDRLEFTQLCRSLRDDPRMRQDPRLMVPTVQALVDQQKVIHWEVRSVQGDLICSVGAPGTMEGLEVFFENIGKVGIRRHLLGRLSAARQKILRPADPAIERALFSTVLGFSVIVEVPDFAHASHVGNVLLYWYWTPFHEVTHPAGLVSIFQSMPHAFRQFLQKTLPDPYATSSGFTLIARDQQSGRLFPSIESNSEIQALLDRAHVSQEVVRATVTWKNGNWLATGAPGKNLQGHSLVALFPEDRVSQRVASLKRAIVWAMILALVFAGVTGIILSRTFLSPIREIARGLQALRRRETGYRVGWSRADELGHLAQSFNGMIENLKEMELAKIVQETLIPSSYPDSRGYEGLVSMTTASRLGGDYADVQKLPDGRILIAIGDVTGHGVGAALLMTMVKAGVFRFSENPTNLSDLGVELNVLVFHHFRRRMLMTFFAAVLEPETGKLEYLCAGHPYPFILGLNNAVRTLSNPQLPLGTSIKRCCFPTFETKIEPGEFLVLYTDGCYEVTNSEGKMLGWDRFCKIMMKALKKGLKTSLESFWESFREHRPEENLEDDCTFILVERMRGKK